MTINRKLEVIGVALNVCGWMRNATNIQSIHVIGDVIAGPMWAHQAEPAVAPVPCLMGIDAKGLLKRLETKRVLACACGCDTPHGSVCDEGVC